MRTRFTKYSALGNDYLVFDPSSSKINLSPLHKQDQCAIYESYR